MHLRPDHAVRDLPTLHAFIRAHPLGVLTTSLPSENFPTLQCSHIPWVLDSEDTTEQNEPDQKEKRGNSSLGVLRGHIARANPQSKAMVEAVTANNTQQELQQPDENMSGTTANVLPGEVLIIFTSHIDHYITPHFYTESKPATGKVAPTWNYAAVQVYGRVTVYHDSKDDATGAFLHQQLSDLAVLGEEGVMGYAREVGGADEAGGTVPAWKIADAPEGYISILKKNIVGMRVEITRIEGRFKVSQERPGGDREGVVDGLERMETSRAREMAGFVRSGRVVSDS